MSKQEALWVLRAQCGDRDALEALLRATQPWLRRYVAHLVGAADADDVVQESLVTVYRKLKWLEVPELFRPWVLRIASRLAFRHLRRERARRTHDEEDVLTVVAPVEAPDDLERRLQNDTSISAASKAVLILHFCEDLSLPDVAAVLAIPLGTVKSRLAYGLSALRKQLRHKEGDPDVRESAE